MGYREKSLSLATLLVILFSVTICAMNSSIIRDIEHQNPSNYSQFLIANGVARTPPMGYYYYYYNGVLHEYDSVNVNFLIAFFSFMLWAKKGCLVYCFFGIFVAVGIVGITFNAILMSGP